MATDSGPWVFDACLTFTVLISVCVCVARIVPPTPLFGVDGLVMQIYPSKVINSINYSHSNKVLSLVYVIHYISEVNYIIFIDSSRY